MPPRSWASLRKIKRHVDSDLPADRERLAIIRCQVADVCDRFGWVFIYDYDLGRFKYVHWLDAVDLLWEHRASLAEPITATSYEPGGRL